jgi:hypothetical protein
MGNVIEGTIELLLHRASGKSVGCESAWHNQAPAKLGMTRVDLDTPKVQLHS